MLSRHFDRKTYSERWVVDSDDAIGLKKALNVAVEHHRGDKFYLLYLGAKLAVDILLGEHSVDKWGDFLREFEDAIGVV